MELTDITHLLTRIFQYRLFEINQTPVTPSSVFMFLFVILVFFLFSRILQSLLKNKFLTKLHIEEGLKYTSLRISHYTLMVIGFLVAFQFIGIDLSGLAVIVGLLSVGIGFGLQNVTSNFVAGIILLIERPIKIGDRVTVGGTEGNVVAINIRSTTIRSLNNISIIVPNSEFVSTHVVNWSHEDLKVRLVAEVGVSYNSDLDQVFRSLYEVAEESPNVLKNPEPDVLFASFGDSSWNMQLRVWLKGPENYYQIRSEINCAIVRKFRQNGIEIPYPQRDLHVRSPLPIPFFSQDQETSENQLK
ncbi:MAG: mechanosensitive ion channel [Deltaproteobacteria bacterium]|nr:mechanosensitive ion channel [Deltaproteobacteria bacterium]